MQSRSKEGGRRRVGTLNTPFFGVESAPSVAKSNSAPSKSMIVTELSHDALAEVGYMSERAHYVHRLVPLQDTASGGCRGTMWIDNLFPIRLNRWDPIWLAWRYLSKRGKATDKVVQIVASRGGSERIGSNSAGQVGLTGNGVKNLVGDKMIEDLRPVLGNDLVIKKIIPRIKDGGAYVMFERNHHSVQETLLTLPTMLKAAQIKPQYSRGHARVHFVYGRPMVDDIVSFYPSHRIKVTMTRPMEPERVYQLFRHFGKLHSLHGSGSEYTVAFNQLHGGIAARNCFHLAQLDGAVFRIVYDSVFVPNAVLKFMQANARFSVVAVAVCLTAATYIIFDPIRIMSVTNQITDTIDSRKFFRWIRQFREPAADAWVPDLEAILNKFMDMLKRRPDSVTFLMGPKGCGKSVLVRQIETDKGDMTLRIDCHHLLSVPDEASFLRQFAKNIGYWPAMSGFKWSMSLIEGLLGASAGSHGNAIQGNVDAELNAMLDVLEMALNGIQRSTGKYPIIIIDGLTASNYKRFNFYDRIARWAVNISLKGIAHIVFVSDNNFLDDSVHVQFNETKVETIVMRDASDDLAQGYVRDRLGAHHHDLDDEGHQDVSEYPIHVLGGRLCDLNSLVQLVEGGMEVREAVETIVYRACLMLRQIGLNEHGSANIGWKKEEMWEVAQMIVGAGGSVDFDKVKYSKLFKGDDSALRALARADIITIQDVMEDGKFARRNIIFARPVFMEAMRRMLAEPRIRDPMAKKVTKLKTDKLEGEIRELEQELLVLSEVVQVNVVSQREDPGVFRHKDYIVAKIAEKNAELAKVLLDYTAAEISAKQTKAAEPTQPSVTTALSVAN